MLSEPSVVGVGTRPHPDTGLLVDSDDVRTEAEFRGRKRSRSDETESFSSSVLSSNAGYSALC
jgi:hypothetical protein